MMMMAKTPADAAAVVRLKKRVGAAFFDEAAARNRMARLCGSSGSEHSSHQSPDSNINDFDDHDLSALVTSFIERDHSIHNHDAPPPPDDDEYYVFGEQESSSSNHHHHHHHRHSQNHNHSSANAAADTEQNAKLQKSSSERYRWSNSEWEAKDMLKNLLLGNNNDDNNKDDDDVRLKIRTATELACREIGEIVSSSPQGQGNFKRALMSRLRDLGFDAGLCKSRWERFGRHPAGEYEYVDVKVGSNRYIVEAFLTGEFVIARPTPSYAALLDVFPRVFVGKPEELKQIVRLICDAIRTSMKRAEMHVPPWRRNGYMQAKWFGPYKRTINSVKASGPSQSNDEALAAKRRNFGGFEALAPATVSSHRCRDDTAIKLAGSKVGYLTAAFNGCRLDICK